MQIFDELDAILGVKPATKPLLTISSETGIPSDIEDEDIQLSPVSDSVLNDESIILQVDEDTVIQSDENVTSERQHELKLWSMMTQWTGRGAFSYSPQTCPPGQPYSHAPLQSYYPTYDQRYDTNND